MGLFKKFRDAWFAPMSFDSLDDDFYDELEESLILADLGVETSGKAVERLRKRVREDHLKTTEEAKDALKGILVEMVEVEKPALHWPMVTLMVGVNGVGKTTTIGKLALRFQGLGRTIILCAADTFRAAAVEQLQSWADKLGIPIYKGAPNQDPASVCYEAHTQAIREGFQYLICDTAGRLHTRHNLMEELSKIRRTLAKQDAAAPHRTLLVVDATTGANALAQAREFHKATPLDSVIITKMDGSGKGGVAVAIMDEMHISPAFLGTGEGAEDFEPFNRDRYVDSLL